MCNNFFSVLNACDVTKQGKMHFAMKYILLKCCSETTHKNYILLIVKNAFVFFKIFNLLFKLTFGFDFVSI